MRSIGALLSASRPRTPVAEWELDRILNLPHTVAVMARIARLQSLAEQHDSVTWQASELQLKDCQERDALAEKLEPGCWCYGHGGSGKRAVMLPGAEVPMVLDTYCDCSAGVARRKSDAELRERGRIYHQEVRLAGIWEGAKVPERFNGCTFETFPSTPQTQLVIASLKTWLDNPNWALVLMGSFGVGKTGLAISALREAAERHRTGLFVKTPDLLARIKATYAKEGQVTEADVLASLRTVEYLVLDDIGADKVTDWATSMLFQVLDDRHDQQRKTILTTNVDITGLGLHMGERTMHRFEEGAVFLIVEGPNLRKDQKGNLNDAT